MPESSLLGRRGEGFKNFLHILDGGRIGVAAMGVGLAQGALDEAISYAKERQAFGQPISKFQSIQAKIADLSAQIEAARLLTWRAALEKDAGQSLHPHRRPGEADHRPARGPRDRGGGADPRRLRLHRGVPGLPLLPRRQDPHDRRGDRRGPADGHRPLRSGARRCKREVDVACRVRVFEPDAAAVGLDDRARDRQAEAGAVLAAGGVAAVEGLEDALALARRDPLAVVGDLDLDPAAGRRVARTVTLPSAGVWRIAFWIRLKRTRWTFSALASATTSPAGSSAASWTPRSSAGRAHRRDGVADQVAELDLAHRPGDVPGLDPRELEEVVDRGR